VSVRRGFTLLEAMVALVILGLVSLAYLELFGGTVRATESAAHWSQAVAYAEDRMESLKLTSESAWERGPEQLDGGFTRRVETRPWRDDFGRDDFGRADSGRDGLVVVSVVVTLPGGGEFAVSRLMEGR
jgi:prepilin-type N-terminal cleavage/methylation domain-containing protein